MAKPVQVCVDGTTWPNDRGFGRFTRELVSALARRGSEYQYSVLFDTLPEAPIPDGIKVLQASTSHSLSEASTGSNTRSLRDLWRLGMAARRSRCDLFFFPAVYSYFPIPRRVPCVICYHDTTAERYPELIFPTKWNERLWRLKTRLALLQTTRAMTVSEASAKDVEEILSIPKRRIDVVTEAADPTFRVLQNPDSGARARSRWGVPESAEILSFVGGMNRHKNLHKALEAMPAVIRQHPNVQLIIVGSTDGGGFWDNVPELRRRVENSAELRSHVRFTGRIGDSDLVEILNTSAALLFPSLSEGFGLPAVEAMACGVPVLASDRGSLPEVIADAGIFFDPEDPSAISTAILQFLSDRATRERLSRLAVARAKTFTWDRAAELTENSFRRCLADASR